MSVQTIRSPAIYLAGPVENGPSQEWREDGKRDHPDVEFINPMDWSGLGWCEVDEKGMPVDSSAIQPADIRTKCERDMAEADGLFAFKPEGVQSDGTAMEIRMAAAEFGIPVAVWTSTEDQLGGFVAGHVDYVGATFDECIQWLWQNV